MATVQPQRPHRQAHTAPARYLRRRIPQLLRQPRARPVCFAEFLKALPECFQILEFAGVT
jgi:hypothetical protein